MGKIVEAFPKAGSTRDDVGDCTRARGVQRSACAVAKKNNQQTEGTTGDYQTSLPLKLMSARVREGQKACHDTWRGCP